MNFYHLLLWSLSERKHLQKLKWMVDKVKSKIGLISWSFQNHGLSSELLWWSLVHFLSLVCQNESFKERKPVKAVTLICYKRNAGLKKKENLNVLCKHNFQLIQVVYLLIAHWWKLQMFSPVWFFLYVWSLWYASCMPCLDRFHSKICLCSKMLTNFPRNFVT